MPLEDLRVSLYLSGAWVDVTTDVAAGDPLRIRYGCWSHGPLARVSETGSFAFSLNNSAQNSGGKLGYYSPGHADCRTGFQLGARVRVVATLGGTDYARFYGKLVQITPVSGVRGLRQTKCLAYDWIDEAAAFDVREIDPQENKRADELVQAIVDSMPTDAQPPQTPTLMTGTDVFPYAFQDLGAGTSALAVFQRIAQSDFGYIDMEGSGILRYRSRHHATGEMSGIAATFDDDDIVEIQVRGDLGTTFNVVRTVVHPKQLDGEDVVLWQQQGTPLFLGVGESQELFAAYVSPDNDLQFAGIQDGTSIAPVASTDYVANTLADGTGTDQTGSVSVTADFFASVVKLTVTNSSGVPVYLTTLQVRGRGIYDLDEQVFEDASTQDYGSRQVEVDLPYQADANVGQNLATYILSVYEDANPKVELVAIAPERTSTGLLLACVAEPGALLEISDSVSGISGQVVRVMGVELEILANRKVRRARWSVERVAVFGDDVWRLDSSELGINTELALV